MKLDPLKERWVLIDNSIYTERGVDKIIEGGHTIKDSRLSIAFNVGPKLGRYLVSLHNAVLESQKPCT